MPFDSVPLAIGNGAVHKDEILRVASNIYTQDTGGINLPHHFKVTATSPVSGSVNIAPGGITVVNPYASGESYVGRAFGQTTISSGLTVPGYHMIVARIIDPDYGPWQPSGTPGAPNTSVADGPYFQPFVVPGVGDNVTEASSVVPYAAEPLALIKNPTGLGQITDAMITDLRRLARPRFWFEDDVQLGTQATDEFLQVSETAWHHWPLNSYVVKEVPRWATDVSVAIHLNNVSVGKTAADFASRVAFGPLTKVGASFDYNGSDWSPVGYVETTPHTIYAEFDVTSLQGARNVVVRPEVQRIWTANTGQIWFTNREQVVFDIRFREKLR